MSGDTPDFEDTTYQQTTATGAAFLDVSLTELKVMLEDALLTVTGALDIDLSEVLSELVTIEGLTVPSAPMQSVTGAPLRYRTGDLILWEDFSKGNGYWQRYVSGAEADSSLDSNYWVRGGQSWMLKGGSSSGYQARLYMTMGRYEKCKMGLEFAFSWGMDADRLSVYFEPAYGSSYARFVVKFNVDTNQIEIRDHEGNYQPVRDPMSLIGSWYCFHHIKLIVDVETLSYETLFVNEEEIDLSSYTAAVGSVSANTPFEVRWTLVGTGGDTPQCWIDCIAITIED